MLTIEDAALPVDFYEKAAELSHMISEETGEMVSTVTANGIILDDGELVPTKEAYFMVGSFRIGEMRYSHERGYAYRLFKERYDQLLRLEEVTETIARGEEGVSDVIYECTGQRIPEEEIVVCEDLVGIMVVDEVFPDNYHHELTEAWAYDNLEPETYLDYLRPEGGSIIFDSTALREKYREINGYLKDAGPGPTYYRVETIGQFVDGVFVLHKWYNPVYGNGARLVRLIESRVDIEEFMTLGAYKDI